MVSKHLFSAQKYGIVTGLYTENKVVCLLNQTCKALNFDAIKYITNSYNKCLTIQLEKIRICKILTIQL